MLYHISSYLDANVGSQSQAQHLQRDVSSAIIVIVLEVAAHVSGKVETYTDVYSDIMTWLYSLWKSKLVLRRFAS